MMNRGQAAKGYLDRLHIEDGITGSHQKEENKTKENKTKQSNNTTFQVSGYWTDGTNRRLMIPFTTKAQHMQHTSQVTTMSSISTVLILTVITCISRLDTPNEMSLTPSFLDQRVVQQTLSPCVALFEMM